MEHQTERKNRIALSDEKIIELYWARDERAIEETDVKYNRYLFSIANNVVHDRLDAEECLNDTYLGAWNAMPPSRPNVLKAFLTTIIRRIAIKRYHSKHKSRAVPSEMTVALGELEAFIADDDGIDAEIDSRELGRVISEFVRSLPRRKRYIFMSRYYIAHPIDKIASDLKLSRSTVNKELAAIRVALLEKLESEGYPI